MMEIEIWQFVAFMIVAFIGGFWIGGEFNGK